MTAFVCITNTGTTELGPNINIYSNVNNYTTIIETVLLVNLIGDNCPYLVENVPDGTTILRLIDPTTGCCFQLPFSDGFNLCEVCENIGFTVTTNPNVGSLSLGALSGDCDPSISNYYMEWYGPGTGSTELLFTSGFGNNSWSNNYQYTHPLTGSSEILLNAGTYRPFLKEMEISGTSFNWAQGAYGDCFQANPFVVLPYTTTNGNGVGDYTHEIDFSASTPNGSSIQSGTIQLSATTNFVPYRFQGGSYKDQFVIYFSGANYSNKIQLDNVIVGQIQENGIDPYFQSNVYPKYAGDFDGFYTKVLCLTAFTRNGDNDVLLFDVIPNEPENPTEFSFYFTQKPTFDCTSCLFDTPPYRLSAASFSATSTQCGNTTINFSVSGCTTGVDNNKDLYNYVVKNSEISPVGIGIYGTNGLIPQTITLGDVNELECTLGASANPDTVLCPGLLLSGCTPPNQNKISWTTRSTQSLAQNPATDREITLTFIVPTTLGCERTAGIQLWNQYVTQYNDIVNTYPQVTNLNQIEYGRILTVMVNNPSFSPPSGGQPFVPINLAWNTVTFESSVLPLPANNVDLYYIKINGRPFSEPDFTTFRNNTVSLSTCVDAGTCTGSTFYSLQQDNMLAQTPPNDIGYRITSDNDEQANYGFGGFGVPFFSLNLNLPQNPIPVYCKTINDGNYLPQNMFIMRDYTLQISPGSVGGVLTGSTLARQRVYQYQLKTIPSSGVSVNSQTNIPSLSADTCLSLTAKTYNDTNFPNLDGLNTYTKWYYNIGFQVTDDSGPNVVYNIFANPISANGQLTSPQVLIGTATGSTVTVLNAAYFT
jgi:hypothetical protein